MGFSTIIGLIAIAGGVFLLTAAIADKSKPQKSDFTIALIMVFIAGISLLMSVTSHGFQLSRIWCDALWLLVWAILACVQAYKYRAS